MSIAGRAGVLLVALVGVGGALASVLLAQGSDAPANELAILLVVLAYAVVAVVISIARPGHVVGRLMLVGAGAWGVGEGLLALAVRAVATGDVTAAGWLGAVGSLRGLGWLLLVAALPLVFPDGRTPWGGHRPLVLAGVAISVFVLALLLAPTPLDDRLDGLDSPTGLPEGLRWLADGLALAGLLLVAATLVLAVSGLVHRWRRGDDLLRQQVLTFTLAFAAPLVLLPLIPTSVVEPWMFGLVSFPVALAVGVALFQRRLYDVQLVASRTTTYLALSAAVAGLYALVVGGIGALLRDQGAVWLPWVAAGVVAVAFAPLHSALQRGVNQLTYGSWSQPASALATTGRRLADAADVPGLLCELVTEMARGLGLSYVQITDTGGHPLASSGEPAEATEEMPLTAYGRTVGWLRWSPPRLRARDRQLLDDLAGQLGGVVHSAGLVSELRDAQERLVLAREEERRRLRRDLHDGLGPALAGLTLQVDTVRNVLAAGGDADEVLLRLRGGVASTVLDVRRIVEGLRPPALDELGLDGALVQLAERMSAASDLTVEVSAPDVLPDMPAAVEVAAYRVAQEALSNAVRHAGASRSRVLLSVAADGINLEVTDDGHGGVRQRPDGIGLTTMHERAAEIGGRLSIRSSRGRGTTVALWLPGLEGAAS